MDFGKAGKSDAKAWKDIWGAGQGVGNIDAVLTVREITLNIEQEYKETLASLAAEKCT
jgi:nitronate monooxygenase